MKNSLKSYLFGTLSITFLSLILTSCGNINSENSRVTITMPYLSSANNSQNIFSAKSSDFNPSTINDINCFAVMVGAAESVMSRTSCEITKTVTTTVSGSSTTSSTVVGEKRVGIIRGLVPSGNTITLDVPSGSGRVFTLVGLHAATTDACLDFTNSDLNFDVISDPYIVGESAPTNLESGVEVTVPIKLAASGTAFTSDSPKVGECYGPDAPGKNKIIPTKFIITKSSFPSMILKENSCNPIEIQYIDDLGRRGSLNSNAYGYISYITTNASGSALSSILPLTFYTDKACSSTANTSGQVVFDKNNDSNSKQIYFNTTSSTSGTNYNLYISNISGLSNSINGSNQTFPNVNANSVTLNIFGASRFIQGECYNLQGVFTSVSGTTYNSGTVKYQVDSPLSEAIFYSGKDCGLANVIPKQSVSSTATSPYVSPSLFDFSVRMMNTPYAKGSLKLIPQLASATAVVIPVEITGGLKNPAQLDLNMWNTFAAGTYCSDAFTISLANEKGSLVPLSTSGTLQITVSSTATVYVKSESCTTLPTPITIGIGEYQKRFAVYPISVSSGAEADIIFTANVVNPITSSSVILKRTQHIKFQ